MDNERYLYILDSNKYVFRRKFDLTQKQSVDINGLNIPPSEMTIEDEDGNEKTYLAYPNADWEVVAQNVEDMWYAGMMYLKGNSDDIVVMTLNGLNAKLSAVYSACDIFNIFGYSESSNVKFTSPHQNVRNRLGYAYSSLWVYPINIQTNVTTVATRNVTKTETIEDYVFELIGTNLYRYPIIYTDANRNIANRSGV